MIVLPICHFSGREIPKGKGIMYVKKDGTVYWFYSRKEKKNFLNLKREGRRVKWTPNYREFMKAQRSKSKR